MSMNNNPVSRGSRPLRVPNETQGTTSTTSDARLGARGNLANLAPPNAPPGRRSGNEGAHRPRPPLQQWVPRATPPAAGAQAAAGPSHMPSPLRLPPAREAMLLHVEKWRVEAEQQATSVETMFRHMQGGQDMRPEWVNNAAASISHAIRTSAPELLIDVLPATRLPEQVGQMTHLTQLTVQGTGCEHLPESIGNLTRLQRLVMSSNRRVTHLPDSMVKLKALHTLEANGMPLRTLPQQIGDMTNLTAVRLSGGTYEVLPPSFTRLFRLETLEITRSKPEATGSQRRGIQLHQGLKELPEDFGRLRALQKLTLSDHAQFGGLPDSFCGLGRLSDLTITYCPRMKHLPERFGELGGLTKLNLSRNVGLEVLPASMARLADLEELDLHGNENLARLPAAGAWAALKKLNLDGCKNLEALPEGLAGLRGLRELNLQGCNRLRAAELETLVRALHPRCKITMPSGEVRRGGSVPPMPVRVPQAEPAIPAYQPPRAESSQLLAWRNRLAPVAGSDTNNRFSQWMEAVCSHGLSETDRSRMNRILDAVVNSAEFRSKAFTFAATHVELARDSMGMTLADARPQTFQGVRHMHDLLLEHQLPGMEGARALQDITEAIRDRHDYLRHRDIDPFLALVGHSPEEAEAMRQRRRHPRKPWGPLVAYVQAHDPAGVAALATASKVMERLGNYASEDPYGPGTADGRQETGDGAGGSGLGRYASFRAESGPADIDDNSYLEMVESVQKASDIALHERYVEVATQLLSQDQVQDQVQRRGQDRGQGRDRAHRRTGRPPRPAVPGSRGT
jgi:Leucine-rich repeat (LRR) protein